MICKFYIYDITIFQDSDFVKNSSWSITSSWHCLWQQITVLVMAWTAAILLHSVTTVEQKNSMIKTSKPWREYSIFWCNMQIMLGLKNLCDKLYFHFNDNGI